MPKTFLTKTSEFFQKCCNGEWKEASTRNIELLEADSNVFSTYLQWLYTGELIATEESRRQGLRAIDSNTRLSVAHATFKALAVLGIFGDMIMDSAFENAVVDEIIKTREATVYDPSTAAVRTIYNNTASSKNIKRLFVDYYASEVSTSYLAENRSALHEDMLFEIMIRLHGDRKALTVKDADRLRPSWESRCDYHSHSDKVPKCT